MTDTLADLKKAAAAAVAQYPQYAGHFDSYVLVRIKRKQQTKMGVAFERDEIAIAAPASRSPIATTDVRTVWSVRNKVDTTIRTYDVEDLRCQ